MNVEFDIDMKSGIKMKIEFDRDVISWYVLVCVWYSCMPTKVEDTSFQRVSATCLWLLCTHRKT